MVHHFSGACDFDTAWHLGRKVSCWARRHSWLWKPTHKVFHLGKNLLVALQMDRSFGMRWWDPAKHNIYIIYIIYNIYIHVYNKKYINTYILYIYCHYYHKSAGQPNCWIVSQLCGLSGSRFTSFHVFLSSASQTLWWNWGKWWQWWILLVV